MRSQRFPRDRLRLLPRAGDAAPDHRLRPRGLSPLALAAWMLDHDTDSYYKIAAAFVDKQPSGGLSRDHVLDNVTLYWLTGTGVSAARSYWERRPSPGPRGRAGSSAGQDAGRVHHVPGRDLPWPRAAGSRRLPQPHLLQRGRQGGHFAAWEEPELFSTEIRAAFSPLR